MLWDSIRGPILLGDVERLSRVSLQTMISEHIPRTAVRRANLGEFPGSEERMRREVVQGNEAGRGGGFGGMNFFSFSLLFQF
jgi:hypothetical protein